MKHDKFPQVSVIISTYDRPAMLDRALASVHAQTFSDFEVIVVDDATPDVDSMQSVVSKWDAKFTERGINLWPYRLETNSGYQCFPKNRGIEHSVRTENGAQFFEALAPVPLDHVPDRERDLVLGPDGGALHVER